MAAYNQFCQVKYREIIAKYPHLMGDSDRIATIITSEWSKLNGSGSATENQNNKLGVNPQQLMTPLQTKSNGHIVT